MAGDFLNIRARLAKLPETIKIADLLRGDDLFLDHLEMRMRVPGARYQRSRTPPRPDAIFDPAHANSVACADVRLYPERSAIIPYAVFGLIEVWGNANEDGKVEDSGDVVVRKATLSTLDAWAEMPGFGQAMATVGWAEEYEDAHGVRCVRLPNFIAHNAPASIRPYMNGNSEKSKSKGAVRAQARRDKLKAAKLAECSGEISAEQPKQPIPAEPEQRTDADGARTQAHGVRTDGDTVTLHDAHVSARRAHEAHVLEVLEEKENELNANTKASSPAKSKTTTSKPEEAPVPVELQTSAFLAVWALWLQHRREKKLSMTPTHLTQQLKKLAGLGADRAAVLVDYSVSNGYQGIVWDYQPSQGAKHVGSNGQGGRRIDLSRVPAKPGEYAGIARKVSAAMPAAPSPTGTAEGEAALPALQGAGQSGGVAVLF